MRTFAVTSADGVRLAVHEAGNPSGPEILFIHGFNQSHLSWTKQFADPKLLAEFRMVAFDLRGHGHSDKPAEPQAYAEDSRWAGDVAAVISARGLLRPVLAGWSYGGRVITDYLRAFGTQGVAGIDFVAAVIKNDSAFMGPGRSHFTGMTGDDLAANIAATAGFVRACFEHPPARGEFETMLAFNMMVPPRVRRMVLDRTPNPGDLLAGIDVPVLLSYGAKDRIILKGMGELGARLIPGATLSLYDDAGHSPFVEDAPRFNAELAAFVRRTQPR